LPRRYKIIYCDPPWSYNDRALAGARGAACKYPVMSTYEISRLPVETLADDDCILFVWCTWPHYFDAQKIIEDWGFVYKTLGFVWIKRNENGTIFKGLGHWTRSNSEYCLLAVKGNPKRIDASVSQVIESRNKEHSKKPDIVRDKILKLCGDLPRIELFARTKIHGWDVWGNDEKLQLQPLESFSE